MWILIPITISILIFSCSPDESNGNTQPSSSSVADGASGTFTDNRDSKVYKWVKIGEQVWMAENLNYKTEGSVCYNNLESNCAIYGRMYTWVAAMALDTSCNKNNCPGQILSKHRGNCPEGWHVASFDEWKDLAKFVDTSTAGIKLRARDVWKTPSTTGEFPLIPGTDEYGFSALPGGGSGCWSNGECGFGQVGGLGIWLTATSTGGRRINELSMSGGDSTVFFYDGAKDSRSYVRCIKGGDGKYFTVDFNTNGGIPATILPVLVDSNVALGSKEPANPVKAGHTFGGWFEGDVKYTASTIIARNLVLTAKWNKLNDKVDGGTLYDARDGKSYGTVRIGVYRWMAENLNHETENSWCYENCEKYGRLYAWDAAMDACPEGWHLPTYEEWDDLIQKAGGYELAGGVLKSQSGWVNNNNWECATGTCKDGNDDFGFAALPGGYYYTSSAELYGIGRIAHWWSTKDNIDDALILRSCSPDGCQPPPVNNGKTNAYFFSMRNDGEGVAKGQENKSHGYSVRCVSSNN